MRNIVLLFVVVLTSVEIYSQNIDFFREDLRFRLIEGKFEVKGDYYFRNNTAKMLVTKLIYPFPKDSSFGKIDSVSCIDLSETKSSVNNVNQERMIFTIAIPAKEFRVFMIAYHQQLKDTKARYILTTTNRWGKPFEQASYELVVENMDVDSLSYIPNKVEVFSDSTKFYWEKENFMPDRDFEVFFTNYQ